MPVDMLISRFFEELRFAVPSHFEREGTYDQSILNLPLPPYRHVFHALCLYEHSNGYHLPRYVSFKKCYLSAFRNHRRYRDQWNKLCPDNKPPLGLLHRIGGWYLDGLSHAHLYCALVQAYEEQRRFGAVLMDARVDAKLKTDITIVTPAMSVRVDIQFTEGKRQNLILSKRADAEASAKMKNSASSQNGNPFYRLCKTAIISRSDMKADPLTGVPLFSPRAIDQLIVDIDFHLGVSKEQAISYGAMESIRMKDLQNQSSGRR
jgi:hypothetical protein